MMNTTDKIGSFSANDFKGVWSAAPTPFKDNMRVDAESVERMVQHHIALGVKGLFLAGSCGEGPWMLDTQRNDLLRAAKECNSEQILLAMQVTENSADRVLKNIDEAAKNGADLAIVASPYFLMNATPLNLFHYYLDIICRSSLPIGIYDRGAAAAIQIPAEILEDLYAEEKVVLLKDSSRNPDRRKIALKVRNKHENLFLLNGDEFDCISPLKEGYDGLLLGGGVFNGHIAEKIRAAVAEGDLAKADEFQKLMNELMWKVYGGKSISCWLTGLKYLLVRLGLFKNTNNYLGYTLTEECRNTINDLVENEPDTFFPYNKG